MQFRGLTGKKEKENNSQSEIYVQRVISKWLEHLGFVTAMELARGQRITDIAGYRVKTWSRRQQWYLEQTIIVEVKATASGVGKALKQLRDQQADLKFVARRVADLHRSVQQRTKDMLTRENVGLIEVGPDDMVMRRIWPDEQLGDCSAAARRRLVERIQAEQKEKLL